MCFTCDSNHFLIDQSILAPPLKSSWNGHLIDKQTLGKEAPSHHRFKMCFISLIYCRVQYIEFALIGESGFVASFFPMTQDNSFVIYKLLPPGSIGTEDVKGSAWHSHLPDFLYLYCATANTPPKTHGLFWLSSHSCYYPSSFYSYFDCPGNYLDFIHYLNQYHRGGLRECVNEFSPIRYQRTVMV